MIVKPNTEILYNGRHYRAGDELPADYPSEENNIKLKSKINKEDKKAGGK